MVAGIDDLVEIVFCPRHNNNLNVGFGAEKVRQNFRMAMRVYRMLTFLLFHILLSCLSDS